jgi:hypothetical protein
MRWTSVSTQIESLVVGHQYCLRPVERGRVRPTLRLGVSVCHLVAQRWPALLPIFLWLLLVVGSAPHWGQPCSPAQWSRLAADLAGTGNIGRALHAKAEVSPCPNDTHVRDCTVPACDHGPARHGQTNYVWRLPRRGFTPRGRRRPGPKRSRSVVVLPHAKRVL